MQGCGRPQRLIRSFGCTFADFGLTYRCLSILGRSDSQQGLRTGVWIPNRGYIQVFGFPTAATHRCLDPQPRLHTGVWSPKRAIVQVATVYCKSHHVCDHWLLGICFCQCASGSAYRLATILFSSSILTVFDSASIWVEIQCYVCSLGFPWLPLPNAQLRCKPFRVHVDSRL